MSVELKRMEENERAREEERAKVKQQQLDEKAAKERSELKYSSENQDEQARLLQQHEANMKKQQVSI